MDGLHRYRTIFISDFHLGTRDCNDAYLLDFLRHNESEYLYLVGDIFDGWALRRSWYWHQYHNDVIQKILRKARKGTKIIYVPGNHDEFARQFESHQFGGIKVRLRTLHTTADGRQLLVLHGDEFDGVVRYAKWLALVGARAYSLTLYLSRMVNRVRTRMGKPFWSLSAYLKHRTKKAVQYISEFEQAVVREARELDVDGVICGHIHHAEMRTLSDVLYLNTGDWVESCTALVEHLDGRLEIIRWIPSARSLEEQRQKSSVSTIGGDGLAQAPLPSLAAFSTFLDDA
ncbi:MAG: UDP-2,3-diacylglucosamine diphosphatase [Bacteroidota bacterium]